MTLAPGREEAATVTRGDGRSGRRPAPRQTPGRYGLLLFLLIATYLLSAFDDSVWIGAAQLGVFVATGFLALRSSGLPRRRARLIALIGLAGSAVAFGLALTRPNDQAIAAASIWAGLLLLATVVVIVRRILAFETVTIQSIFAAVSAYLMIGLMFAAFYAADYQLHGRFFFADHQPGTSQTFQYFSFTTLTTLGYGDFTAANPGGRAVAVLEALTGQIFLATLVARLVAAFRAPSSRAEDGERGQD
ncbi:MAG: potassium channel family protein [Streptosporangiaceae bacterium]